MIINILDSNAIKLINYSNPQYLIFSSIFNDNIGQNILNECVKKLFFGFKIKNQDYNYSIKQMIYKEELITDTVSFSKFNNKSINYLSNNIEWIVFDSSIY